MIGMFLQTLGFQDVLYQLETLGLFDFILPFILLFAIVYGIMTQAHIFKDNKPVQVIIALAIGLLGLRFPPYVEFLNVISPKLGVGLVILLVLVLLSGLFVPEGAQPILGWILIGVGVIIALVIFAQSYQILGGYGFGGFDANLIGWVILIGLLIGLIVAVVVGGQPKQTPAQRAMKLASGLFGGNHH